MDDSCTNFGTIFFLTRPLCCRALLSFSGLPNTCLLRDVLRSLIYVLSDKIDASSSMSMCGYHDQTREALLSVKDYERKKARQERA